MDYFIHPIVFIFPFHLEDIVRCTASPHAAPNERVMPALIRSGRRISAVHLLDEPPAHFGCPINPLRLI